MAEYITFFVGAAIILVGAIGVVASRNPVHSALFLIQTLLGVAVLFVVQDRIVPLTNLRLEAVSDQIRGKPPRSHGFPLENRWAFGPDGRRLYHYRLYEPSTGTFHGFRVFTLDRDAARVVDHRALVGIAALPHENDPPLVVDSNRVRTLPVTS